jgi:hypothetical protein
MLLKMQYAYIHTCMHTYLYAYIYAYIHTYIHACIHRYIHTCIHTYKQTYIHTCSVNSTPACHTQVWVWVWVWMDGWGVEVGGLLFICTHKCVWACVYM